MPKAAEEHFRVSVGHVVPIPVRVEEQVRRIEDEVPAAPVLDGGANIQAIEEDAVFVEATVAVGVFVIEIRSRTAHAAWRRIGHLVVDRAPVVIVADHFQPRRLRILPVFDDPHTTVLVEVQEDRLRDVRLGEDEVPREIRIHPETLRGLLRRLARIVFEAIRLATDDRRARRCRAPVLLDVLDHQVRAREVRDEGPHLRIVHRVGEIA
jgi:hypothetical protein